MQLKVNSYFFLVQHSTFGIVSKLEQLQLKFAFLNICLVEEAAKSLFFEPKL